MLAPLSSDPAATRAAGPWSVAAPWSVLAPAPAQTCRTDTPGEELELLVLASDRDHCAGIDLASGALVRAWSTDDLDADLRPYDVVAGRIHDSVELLPDPTEPEAVVLIGALAPVGRITGRRAERYIRRLVHPAACPLLGLHGPAVPFWERTRNQPSIAIVEPQGPATLRQRGRRLTCSFTWRGAIVEMPCLDRRVGRTMVQSARTTIRTGRGNRLLVALAPPVDGHCHKVVTGVLPRP